MNRMQNSTIRAATILVEREFHIINELQAGIGVSIPGLADGGNGATERGATWP